MQNNIKYRADIDGLRALAILTVVIFHAFPLCLPGGFIGVDIFFVISGFLISGIILKGLHNDQFSFIKFYIHRIKRIFPALILVLTCSYIFAWFVLLPDEFKQLGKHIAASTGFIQNYVLLYEAGYFDTASELKPLMHLWSLSIEEQFYLIFPFVIWLVWRLGINIFTIILITILLSFIANMIQIEKNIIKAFFIPFTRFWELLLGAALSYCYLFKYEKINHRAYKILIEQFVKSPHNYKKNTVNNLISFIGIIFILLSLLIIDRNKLFPGWLALLPVIGTAFFIWAGPNAWLNQKVFSNKIMLFFGIISYPLYLWHWPIFSYIQIINGEISAAILEKLLAIFFSVVLAYLTYKFIERPIRFGKNLSYKIPIIIALHLIIGSIGFYTYKMNGFEFRCKKFEKIYKAAGKWDYPGELKKEDLNGIKYYIKNSNKQQISMFIGDSNIEQYYPRLENLINNNPDMNNSIIFKTGGGCLPIPNLKYDTAHKHCTTLMSDALEIIKSNNNITTIVIGAAWNGYFLHSGGLAKKIRYGSNTYNKYLDNLSNYIKDLIRLKKEVYIVLSIPKGVQLNPKYILQRDILNFPHVFKIRADGIEKKEIERKFGKIQSDLTNLAKLSRAKIIDPLKFLCGKNCECLDHNGEPMYKDSSHLSPRFVRNYINFIDTTVS